MIEKLNAHLYKDTTDMFEDYREKINEVIDVINELQEQVKKTDQNLNFEQQEVNDIPDGDDAIQEVIHEQQEPKEKYKPWWVLAKGKLCKFWSYDNEPMFGILDRVYIGTKPFKMAGVEEPCGWYEHCIPVKSDDDIIYKGGDNE